LKIQVAYICYIAARYVIHKCIMSTHALRSMHMNVEVGVYHSNYTERRDVKSPPTRRIVHRNAAIFELVRALDHILRT